MKTFDDKNGNKNMEIWDALSKTDPQYTKEFGQAAKGFAGTAINATYVKRKLTDTFGPAGKGWGFSILDEQWKNGHGDVDNKTIVHVLRIEFWVVPKEGERLTTTGYGQTYFVRHTTRGWTTDDEAPKKSLTDAITKCAVDFGMSADVFLGEFDDNKYVTNQDINDFEGEVTNPKQPATSSKPSASNTQTTGPKTISEKQGKRLFAIAKTANYPIDDLKAYLLKKYGYKSLNDITWNKYEEICKHVQHSTPDIPF